MQLRTTEVPVRFLRDKEGRVSHHRRAGWFSPFKAAWINVRAMFVYGAEAFLLKPGFALFITGLLVTLALSAGPLTVGRVTFSLYSMLLGVTLGLVGLQSFYLGCIAQVLHDYTGRARRRWLPVFKYNRIAVLSAVLLAVGATMVSLLLVSYLQAGLTLTPESRVAHAATLGLFLVIASFMTFTATLVLNAAALVSEALYGPSSRPEADG